MPTDLEIKIQKELDKENKQDNKKYHFKQNANGVVTYTGDPAEVLDYWTDKDKVDGELI